MSSIHYKFKAALEYKTLVFDGLHISVNDLKKEICEKEHIKTDSFDLVLYNAYTNQPYREVIPRNSSVIVQRTPRDNAAKLPKVHDTSNSGIVNKPTSAEPAFVPHIESEKFDKMTEEERISHIKEVSYSKYQPANFQKKTSSILSGPPPPTYVCNRCSQPGHWYKNCPMLNTKRTTGLTMDELTETTADDPLAMLHPSGRFVVPTMHMKARQQKKVETAATSEGDTREIPADLKCPLCSQLLRDAVLATCCGDSFCAECVQQRLLESSNAKCPGTNCFQSSISADKLIPNIKLRRMVENFKNAAAGGHASAPSVSNVVPSIDNAVTSKPAAEESVSLQPVQRVRIGLGNRTTTSSSVVVAAVHQSAAQAQQSQQQEPQVPLQTLPATTSQSATPYSPIVVDKNAIISAPSTSTASQQAVVPANCTPPQQIIETSVPPPPIPAAQVTTNLIPPVPVSTVLPVNIHQPPPGYAPILHTVQSALPDTSIAPPGTVGSRSAGMMHHVNTPPVLMPPNIQPPPPGLSAPTIFPAVAAPPPVKDAWDEFLERKEKDRQRANAMPRTRRSSRSSSYSSSATSSSQSSDSRSRTRSHSRTRSRSWSRERNLRNRRRPSRERRVYRRRGSSRSPRVPYVGNRYHRDINNFMMYQPAGSNALPPSSYQQHRGGGSLSGFPPIPGMSDSVTGYAGFAGNAEYRSTRNYDDRGYRRSPRTAVPDYRLAKRRSSSKDRDVERKDRYEETRRRNEDHKKPRHEGGEKKHAKTERKHVKSKHKDRGEKDENKTKEVASHKKQLREKVVVKSDVTDSDEVDKEKVASEVVTLEASNEAIIANESDVTAEAIKDENEEDTTAVEVEEEIAVESDGDAGVTVLEDEEMAPATLDDRIDKEDKADAEIVSEEKKEKMDDIHSAKEEAEPALKTEERQEVVGDKKADVAVFGESNRNEADSTTIGDEKDKNEKKKKKKKKKKHKREEKGEKKKRHRHSTEDSEGEKKHKKHKRSKEEKEKRREEKERRREERRRRKQNKSENVEEDKEAIASLDKVAVQEVSTGVPAIDAAKQVKIEELHYENAQPKTEEPRVAADLPVRHSKMEDVPAKPSRSRHQSLRDESKTRRKHRHSEKTEEHSSEKKHEEEKHEKRSKHDEVKEEKEKSKKLKPVEDVRKKEGLKSSNSPKNEKSREVDTPASTDKAAKREKSPHKAEKYHSARKDGKKKDVERDTKVVEKVKVKESREHSSKAEASSSKSKTENDERRSEKRKSEVDRDDHKRPRQNERKDDSAEKKRERGRVNDKTSKDKPGDQLLIDIDSIKNDASTSGVVSSLKMKEKADGSSIIEKDMYDRGFGDEESLDVRPETLRGIDVQKDKPNITVEVKLGGEKKVTRENIFENAGPTFNARQKIKMILLSESQRFAADRAKKRGSKLVQ